MRSTVSGIAGTGTVMLDIALVFYIIGFAAPFWLIRTNFPAARSGLWQSCEEQTIQLGMNISHVEFVCQDTKTFVNDDWNSTWVPGWRAMMSLGLMFLFITVVNANIYACMTDMVHKGRAAAYITMCFSFATWIISLTGILIHGIRKYDNRFTGFHFSWCFGLCCTSSCLVLLATVLYFAETVSITNSAMQEKTGRAATFLNRGARIITPVDTNSPQAK